MKKTLLTIPVIFIAFACNNEYSAISETTTDNPYKKTSVQAGRQAPERPTRTVFKNINVIHLDPSLDTHILKNHRVSIVGNQIESIGLENDVAINEGDLVIDGQQGYLLPGLIDSHVHLIHDGSKDPDLFVVTDPAQMAIYLQQGITSVRPYSGAPSNIEWRDKVSSHEWLGTRIVTSGPKFHDFTAVTEGLDLPFTLADLSQTFLDKIPAAFPQSSEEIVEMAKQQKAHGYDFYKVYSGISEPLFLALAEHVNKQGGYLTGHLPQTSLETSLQHLDEVAHIVELVDAYYREKPEMSWLDYEQWLVEQMLAHQVALVFNWSTDEAVMKMEQGEPLLDLPRYGVIPEPILANWREAVANELEQTITQDMHNKALSLVKTLNDAGIIITAGSDTGDPGSIPEFVIRDLELMQDAGISPIKVIETATSLPAKLNANIQKTPQILGQIKVGYLADLVLVPQNPLENVSHLRERLGVMSNGHWLTQQQLDHMVSEFVNMPVTPHAPELK